MPENIFKHQGKGETGSTCNWLIVTVLVNLVNIEPSMCKNN